MYITGTLSDSSSNTISCEQMKIINNPVILLQYFGGIGTLYQ